jgi:mono/diheme cytochrome c family protein
MRHSVVVVALLVVACQRTPSQLTYDGADVPTQAAKIAHGKRLSVVLDCTGCHGANLQGEDMADKPEDGAIYSPNITLKIPTYTDAQLDRLIRHGVPNDGREFWFMPVESFQFLSDKDSAGLIAYLRTLRPTGKALPPFRFNRAEHKDVEQGILGNAQAQIAKYRSHTPLDLGPQHAWGHYLVQTTCTACHNNALQGWPNFTPDLDIAGTYSKPELMRLLTTGESKTGKDVAMSRVARRNYSHLTSREREAIVEYILARANRPQAGRAN